ncbi:nitrile hydratase subunit alpha [Stappia sp. ES.058]|uniref:nitrile hydratase subunit alpha n=1 Tax=Stappia sp. ES.058 TaxID=1881061 RepID=UPI00087A9F67|nr:nitrile hydratase subunit alpha [Stappia sp. ES.058]SDU31237.1 Nitrile hydratase, alpha chain [Stappia sp. ES.058]
MVSSPKDDKGNREIMARIVVKAWTDPDYAKMLSEQPHRMLEEEGFEFEKGGDVKVQFHFDTKTHKNIVIPSPPDLLKLDRDDLMTIAAQMVAIQLELF